MQAPAINFLRRLGVLDRVRNTGARSRTAVDLRQEDFRARFDVSRRPGDDGAFMSVRRFVLEPILLDAAAAACADVLTSTNVVGLIDDEGRVAGVRTASQGRSAGLRAKLVVGADGRNSTVATLAAVVSGDPASRHEVPERVSRRPRGDRTRMDVGW
ncbi:MAG: FAD-dependent oxidoreductase [Solirubrobacteraceae bacterium]